MSHVELGRIILPAKVRRAGASEYPVLSMTMRDGLVDQADKFKKRIASADTSPYKVVERNQLVVGFPIDEGVLAFQNLYDEAIVSPAYNVWDIRDDVSIDRMFLEKFLRSPGALAFYRSKLRSTTARRRSLPNDIFLTLEVPLPPLAEQERIVKLLDEADDLRKLRTQADRRTANLLPSLFHEMFGESKTRSFDRVRLEQIADVVSGVAKGRKFNGQQPVEVSYLRVANVQAGHLDLSEIKTIQALPQEVEELALRKGDVLLTEGGDFDKLGRGAMLEQDLPNCIHQNHVFRVRTDESRLEPVVFAKFLMTDEAKSYFLSCAKRTTNLASINMTQLRALPVPILPLAQQKEFARRVIEISELEASQTASRLRLEALFQSMIHCAFNGELTGATEVVELQSSPEFVRSVLAAEIVDRMHSDRTFGQVKLQKVIHLAEYIIPIAEISSEPERFAAGPHDPKLIAQVETKMKDCDWFEAVPRTDGYGNEYRPLAKAGGHREHFEKLWPKQAAAIRRLIDEMKTWRTERCERFATVYAAWNDLLIWGKPADDAAILDQVLKHWHTAKQQIPKASWVETLTWMKREGYIPTGFGRATAPKPQAELFPS